MIRRTTTKKLFAKSIEELTAVKNADKIRIRDITENCGYTQPMFYYYFKDKDDLINTIFREQFESMTKDRPADADIRWLFETIGNLIHEKRIFYQNVLKNIHGTNSLYNYSAQMINEYILYMIREKKQISALPEHLEMMLEFYILGIRSVTVNRITNGPEIDQRHMIEQFINALPSDLKPYLL